MQKAAKLDFSIPVSELTEEHKKEMEKHGNFSQDTIKEHYDELCTNYEDIYLKAGFHDPEQCANLVRDLFPDIGIEDKSKVQILDMGCGTGLVGKYLYDFGFKGITGVDASKGMLDEASRKEGVYGDLIELFLGKPETYPENLRGKYDFITASGILADNHLDCSVFEEMLLSLKKGGIAIFATRTEYLEKYAYGPYMKKLEDEGKWKFVKETTFNRYD